MVPGYAVPEAVAACGRKGIKAVIIGAGFTGLAAANELTKAGLNVVVLDGDEHPGGLAGAARRAAERTSGGAGHTRALSRGLSAPPPRRKRCACARARMRSVSRRR